MTVLRPASTKRCAATRPKKPAPTTTASTASESTSFARVMLARCGHLTAAAPSTASSYIFLRAAVGGTFSLRWAAAVSL
jgi:hypothetical protein